MFTVTNKTALKPSPLPFIFMNDRENLPAAICRKVCVEWVNLGEGVNGDYDPQDPVDVNLLRYDAYVYEAGRWNDIENASYCTNMPADAEPELLGRVAAYMARELAKALVDPNRSVKMVAGKLSWLGDGDFSDEKRILWEKDIPLPERAPVWIDYKKEHTQYFHKDSKTAKILENVLYDPNDRYFVERRFIFCPKCNNGQQSDTVCECCGAPIDMEKAYSLSNSTTYEEAYRVLHDVTKVYVYKKGTRLVTVMRSQQWEPSAQALRVYPAYRLHITTMDMETGALRLRVVTQRGTKSKPVGQNYNIVLEAPCISQLDKFPELIEELRKELANYYNLAANDVPKRMEDILLLVRHRGSMYDFQIAQHGFVNRWSKDRRNLQRQQKKGSAEYQRYLFGNAPKSIRRMILKNPYVKFAYEFMTDTLGFQNVDVVRNALNKNWFVFYSISMIVRGLRDMKRSRSNDRISSNSVPFVLQPPAKADMPTRPRPSPYDNYIWAAGELAREFPNEKQRLRYWTEAFEGLCKVSFETEAGKKWHLTLGSMDVFLQGVRNLSEDGAEDPFRQIWSIYKSGCCHVNEMNQPLYYALIVAEQQHKYGSLNALFKDIPAFSDVQQDGYTVRCCRTVRDTISAINKIYATLMYSYLSNYVYVGVYEGHTLVRLLAIKENHIDSISPAIPYDSYGSQEKPLWWDAVEAWAKKNSIMTMGEWLKQQTALGTEDNETESVGMPGELPF